MARRINRNNRRAGRSQRDAQIDIAVVEPPPARPARVIERVARVAAPPDFGRGATMRRSDLGRAAASAARPVFAPGVVANATARPARRSTVRDVALSSAVREKREKPREESDNRRADVCKEKPTNNRGSGKGRPFVPWCK